MNACFQSEALNPGRQHHDRVLVDFAKTGGAGTAKLGQTEASIGQSLSEWNRDSSRVFRGFRKGFYKGSIVL